MHFLSEEFIAGAVALLGFVFLQIVVWSKVVDLKSEIDALEHRLKEKAESYKLEGAKFTIYEHTKKLEALEAHLGIKFVEEPKRLVVKKTLEK